MREFRRLIKGKLTPLSNDEPLVKDYRKYQNRSIEHERKRLSSLQVD